MKFLPVTFCALMLAGSAMFAQQEQQPPSNNPNAQTQTITGCLTKSTTNSNEYVLSEQNTGQKYTFAGPSRLDNYVNHTVQMTGTMMNNQNGEKQFQPQSVKTVSNSCQGGGGGGR